jgi:hypothetical protein
LVAVVLASYAVRTLAALSWSEVALGAVIAWAVGSWSLVARGEIAIGACGALTRSKVTGWTVGLLPRGEAALLARNIVALVGGISLAAFALWSGWL